MPVRENPYGAFNFLVELEGTSGEDQVVGGFSDVTGLGSEIGYAEYRNGNDKENHPRKVPTLSRTSDVVLARGVIGDTGLFDWLAQTRQGDVQRRTVTITLLDEARRAACRWVLRNALPKKWVGPALDAKGGGEVAMEELHLVAERIDYEAV